MWCAAAACFLALTLTMRPAPQLTLATAAILLTYYIGNADSGNTVSVRSQLQTGLAAGCGGGNCAICSAMSVLLQP